MAALTSANSRAFWAGLFPFASALPRMIWLYRRGGVPISLVPS
jgi:hypothetical protein